MEWLIVIALVVTIFFWATNVVSGLVSSIFFFLSMWLTMSAPLSVIFSGFASSAFWLVFSGTVIGYSLKNSGLSDRIAGLIAVYCEKSYNKALLNFVIISTLLSFIMPSTFGRIAILIPIITSFCDEIGLSGQSLGRTGLILTTTLASFVISSAILTANLPNLILVGVSQENFNINISYGEYLLYFFLTLGILKGAILIIVAKIIFPETFSYVQRIKKQSPLSNHEKYLLVLLTLTILGWGTDFIHHVPTAVIGLIFSFIYLISISRTDIRSFISSLKLDLFLFIASIISFSSIIQYRGLASIIAQHVNLLYLFDGSVLYQYLFLVFAAIILTLMVTSNISPAIFSPLFGNLSNKFFTTKAILLSQVIGYSNIFLPYQALPIIFGANLGGVFNNKLITKYCFLTGAFSFFIVIPINYFWWRLIHLIG